MRGSRLGLALAAALLLAACTDSTGDDPDGPGGPGDGTVPSPGDVSGFEVDEIAGGFTHPWDVGFLPGGQLLITERPGRITLLGSGEPGARATEVAADLDDVYAEGEGGLMGIAVHPDFAESREFTTCQAHGPDGQPVDVRLVTWRLSADGTRAEHVRDLVTGLPLNPSGRHSGCRPAIGPDGELLVGTGDSADPHVPQDRGSLGGSMLRVDLDTGQGLPDNPFAGSDDADERRIASYGHRNIQGVAVHPDTGQVLISEHGPAVADEINLLELGGNYGWDPGQGGTVDSYDENVPMTDLERYPDAVPARWDTGDDTEALCGAAVLDGRQWGRWDGALAVAALRGEKLLLFGLDADAEVTEVAVPEELDGTYGRLRAARTGPEGALYVTTTNGDDDTVLRVRPAS
ncbi:Glucose/arabinose dehydrogenase, beta-propeller fold [Haloechinothrix alba]|uniref:Glucose/arabinose dehydrogenase, beta-propeller fold n=1 Tax=Haloechinothrix alba TaxID=664784 RepID=A0A238VE57_9PSEU|nr:PQQ-dependent sugar dehydrogenase [Haloechinothrix alba]SNR32682.1 Glucose/arabinose dehydrogenase, beta-propeller fold [Haloechinothrix alba]